MAETQIIPERWKVLSGSALKCIALITMIVDHTAYVLLTKGTHLYTVMRAIGRLAFPIYCFLITEGFLHTRDRKKYGIRLFLFALISELPWNLMNRGTLLYEKQNVFLTLLLGYLGLCAVEYFKDRLSGLFAKAVRKSESVPYDYMLNHMVCDFAETIRWWAKHSRYSPEEISAFFFEAAPGIK